MGKSRIYDWRRHTKSGKEILLDFPVVSATENLIMAASTVPGTTIIRNAAREPEIVDLQNFLNRMGARIKGRLGFHSNRRGK